MIDDMEDLVYSYIVLNGFESHNIIRDAFPSFISLITTLNKLPKRPDFHLTNMLSTFSDKCDRSSFCFVIVNITGNLMMCIYSMNK